MEDNKQEDLDMLFILRSIKKVITNIANTFGRLIRFSLKKSFTLFIFMSVIAVLFSSVYFLQKPYYSSQLIISHTRFENSFCGSMINNLNSYAGNYLATSELADRLSLTLEEAKDIKKISYQPVNANMAKLYADSMSVFLPFVVLVDVYNNDVLPNLQKGLLNYLENNDYASKRKEMEKESLIKTEEKIKNEIVEIDSLKQLINQSIVPRGSGTGIILGEPIDPVSVYKRGLELYERQLALSKKQAFNNSFEVIVGFYKRPNPSSSGLFFYIFIGMIVGYLLGICWLLRRGLGPLKA